jgi:hypothetical protein
MQKKNLQFVAEILAEKLTRPEDYFVWLNSGVRAIVLNGTHPAKAFDYARGILGADADAWQKDVVYLAGYLGDRLPSFHFAIAECLRAVEPDQSANDPSKNDGKNLESLAIALLSLARQLKVSSALQRIEGLIHTKLANSQAVYDAALLTWRIMADYDGETDWIAVFHRATPAELRYRNQYSSVLAFGMCVARPSQSEKYLRHWSPLQNYLESLEAEASEKSLVTSTRLVEAIAAVLHDQGILASRSFVASDICVSRQSGQPLHLGKTLQEAAYHAGHCRWQLPGKSRSGLRSGASDFA